MKYLAVAIALLSMPAQAASPISMTVDSTKTQYNTPSYGYTTCYYKQSYPYSPQPLSVRVVVSGMCPYSIKYDPTTGTWTR